MKLLPRILNRIAFVRAEFLSDGSLRTEVFEWSGGKCAPVEWPAVKGALTAVVVCGQGVVSKPDDAEISMRVKADGKTFLWSSADGRTSFVRRERLQAIMRDIEDRKIVPMEVFCADAATDFCASADGFAAQLRDSLRWKRLLRPCRESSAAAQAVVRRLALPVLGVFLILLVGNMLFSSGINTRRQLLQRELTAREHTASTSASVDARQQELLSQFAARPAVRRTVVCDRIAHAVPAQVTLTSLEVDPLAKRFEARKPFLCKEGGVLIEGTAPTAADISLFTGRLSELTCCREVRLTSVEKQRDGSRLSFRIELGV